MIVFFLGYLFYHGDEVQPTGFIQYDNVSYMAYAKEYTEADSFSLRYSNPFNDKFYKPIYFQPQTLFFAALIKTGIPPGWILIPFTLFFSLICFRLIIAIYDLIVPDKSFRTLHIWFFAWGGGLLTIAGAFAHFILNKNDNFLDSIFILDPERGWWGLNLGRSLFFTCEAYYHAVFLGCIYFLLKRKWLPGLLLVFLLSVSHPFTGIELISIIGLWCIVEFIINKKNIPLWFMSGILLILIFHVWYYLFYLNQFADHKSVSEQYALGWRLRFFRIIPAYFITGLLAIFSIYNESVKNFFVQRSNRLFACWFLAAFMLANHEIFIKAMQPIHFTRGYIWTSLFLLGLPALLQWNKFLQKKYGYAAIVFFATIFFLDNFLWVFNIVYTKAETPFPTYISKEQKQVLKWLDEESSNKTLIISSDPTISYLSTVYTKAYPWYSHPYTTPFAEKKKSIQNKFLSTGVLDSSWINREINFVLTTKDTASSISLMNYHVEKIFQTENYLVLKYIPPKTKQ